MKLTGLISQLGFAPQENTLGFYALQDYTGNPSARSVHYSGLAYLGNQRFPRTYEPSVRKFVSISA